MPRKSSRRTPQTPFEGSRAEDVYEVEAVEAKRRKGGLTEYFVCWKDHPPAENTWEPMANLQGAEEMVNAFEREWQVRYDLAAAAATQAREKRREAARLAKPSTPPDSPLEQAQNQNRVHVAAAAEQRDADATAGRRSSGMSLSPS
jgi:hypothetical protein